MNHDDNRHRIILPREAMQEELIQQQMQQVKIDMHGQSIPQPKIPFLQIPVVDNASFLLYAIGKHALDSKDFEQFPIILARIQEMHDGLLVLYKQYGVKETEYRKFCVAPTGVQEPTDAPEGLPQEPTDAFGLPQETKPVEQERDPETVSIEEDQNEEGGEGSELIRQSEEDT